MNIDQLAKAIINMLRPLINFLERILSPTFVPEDKLQISVQERLHYSTEIGLRTYITPEKSEGEIEIIIPAQAQKRAGTKKEDSTSTKKPYGYLGLSDYKATIWAPPLREDGTSVKIPVWAPTASTDGRSFVKFNYKPDLQTSTLPTRPVFLETRIVDGSLDNFQEAGISFYDNLRLELTISSEAGSLPKQHEELVMRQLEEEIREVQGQIKRLEQRLRTQTRKDAKGDIQDNEQHTEDLNKAEEKLKEYRALRDDRKDDRIRFYEFFNETLKKWRKYNSPSLIKISEELLHRVKLAYIEIRTPYIRHLVPTEIGSKNGSKESVEWHYNPERNSLELTEQVLTWNENTNLYETQLYLDIDPPIGDIPELEGSLAAYIDEPISQLVVNWFSQKESEANEAIPITCRTWLMLDFKIDFVQIFKRRSFMSGRRLHFEGVVFQPEYLDNIRHILSNHRLTILSIGDGLTRNKNENKILAEIIALRQGAYQNLIGVQVRGQVRDGTHTIIYNDQKERLIKSVKLGDLDINLWTKMSSSSAEINELLSAIQMDLERYFTSMAMSDLEEE